MKAYLCCVWGLCLLFVACHPPAGTQTDPFADFDARVAAITAQIPVPVIPERTIDLTAFAGHAPDRAGTHDFQPDINRAIQELAAQGGGTLHFRHLDPPQQWYKFPLVYRIRGPILLESNVELLIDHSIILQFDWVPTAYLPGGQPVLRRYEGTTMYGLCPLFYAFRKENIRIRGNEGFGAPPLIDGDGEDAVRWSRAIGDQQQARQDSSYYNDRLRGANNAGAPLREQVYADLTQDAFRPTMMEFFLCKNVEVDGLQLNNSPFWLVHPVFSENIAIRNLIFDSQTVNSDGVDAESSHNVLIEHCIFNNHDDNLAVKAGRDREGREGVNVSGTELAGVSSRYIQDNRLGGPSTDIVFRHNTLQGHFALAIGSEMSGGVEGVYAYDCTAPISVKAAVFIKSSRRRGGYVRHVYVQDFQINRTPLDLITIIPNYDGDTAALYPPQFSDLYFRNISANYSGNPYRVYGWPDVPTQNVWLEHIRVKAVKDSGSFNHVRGLRLRGVEVGGEVIEGDFDKSEAGEKPPKQT
ncbi:MAG: exopolygalacturonase PelB [Bacteroidia bacterium]